MFPRFPSLRSLRLLALIPAVLAGLTLAPGTRTGEAVAVATTAPATVTTAPAAATTGPGSWLAIDTTKQLAWVPLRSPDPRTHRGRVAVLNLAVDPNRVNPLVATIVLPTRQHPGGTALDVKDGLVFVESGKVRGRDGYLYEISASTNSVVKVVPLPRGSQLAWPGVIWFDARDNAVIVDTCDTATCSVGKNEAGSVGKPQTGFALYSLSTGSFEPIIKARGRDLFSFDARDDVIIGASRGGPDGQLELVSVRDRTECILRDRRVRFTDGSAFDPTTDLEVVTSGNGTATAVDLHSLRLSGLGTTHCTASQTGGRPSALLSGLPLRLQAGAADPVTHQVFLPPLGVDSMALLSLPAAKEGAPPRRLKIRAVTARVPDDPNGYRWPKGGAAVSLGGRLTSRDPSTAGTGAGTLLIRPDKTRGNCCRVCCVLAPGDWVTAVDPLHDRGYARNINGTFLLQVDLRELQQYPRSINAPLQAGHCAGVHTRRSCSNGKGVTFFPLP